jgi:DNA (cytosine-5)-methyltransferase 1
MRHVGLFEGIGGFSLAARWAGWETVAWCEWNEFGQKVLRHHFPKAKGHGDITQTDFTIYRGQCDIVTGGFPCQPYSAAGKRLGKEDERHLWPEMLRAIREIQPRWVVGENVLGLVNWSGGLVFQELQTDLENSGYEVFPYVLPACAIGAAHRRDRVWIVAHDVKRERNGRPDWNGRGQREQVEIVSHVWRERGQTNGKWKFEPNICRGTYGVSKELDIDRTKRHQSLGNAIVPQVAFQIFQAINQYENK